MGCPSMWCRCPVSRFQAEPSQVPLFSLLCLSRCCCGTSQCCSSPCCCCCSVAGWSSTLHLLQPERSRVRSPVSALSAFQHCMCGTQLVPDMLSWRVVRAGRWARIDRLAGCSRQGWWARLRACGGAFWGGEAGCGAEDHNRRTVGTEGRCVGGYVLSLFSTVCGELC